MLHKTRGIVLRTINHRETSVICHIFTEKFGLQSYIINGVKKSKAKIHINILQPLHLLEMVVYHKPSADIQRVAEARQLPQFQSIPYDDKKRAFAIFLTEVLQKCLKQQSADGPLFDYIYYSISWLDNAADSPPEFHLYFLIQLSKYLGFFPSQPQKGLRYFDLKDGVFSGHPPYHEYFLEGEEARLWLTLMSVSLTELLTLRIPLAAKRKLLNRILDYYALHIENFGKIQSHLILEEVFN